MGRRAVSSLSWPACHVGVDAPSSRRDPLTCTHGVRSFTDSALGCPARPRHCTGPDGRDSSRGLSAISVTIPWKGTSLMNTAAAIGLLIAALILISLLVTSIMIGLSRWLKVKWSPSYSKYTKEQVGPFLYGIMVGGTMCGMMLGITLGATLLTQASWGDLVALVCGLFFFALAAPLERLGLEAEPAHRTRQSIEPI